MAAKSVDSELTRESFQNLLDFLGPDTEAAGERYEEVRRKLIRIFACRGSPNPEELADKTINRVARKCSEIARDYVGDPLLYFRGVARRVFLESVRKRPTVLPMPEPDPWEEKEVMDQCLEDCMTGLTRRNRELILEYYRDERGTPIRQRRQKLAQRFGKSTNALRIAAHRIRAGLQKCVFQCLREQELE